MQFKVSNYDGHYYRTVGGYYIAHVRRCVMGYVARAQCTGQTPQAAIDNAVAEIRTGEEIAILQGWRPPAYR